MPLYVSVSTNEVVKANRHLIGHPCPTGFRALTAAEALVAARGDKRAALVLHTILYAYEVGTCNGRPAVWFLEPGQWVIRFPNGFIGIMRDEFFHKEFAAKER